MPLTPEATDVPDNLESTLRTLPVLPVEEYSELDKNGLKDHECMGDLCTEPTCLFAERVRFLIKKSEVPGGYLFR